MSPFIPDTTPVVAGAPHWAGEFAILSGNAVLSGVTAGVVRKLHHGSFREGFLRGLAGGGVVYVGKRVVAEHFSGSGLLGREVAAVGTSMVANAGDGVGALDRLILPAGIARFYIDRRPPPGAPHLRFRLDAVATGWTIYGLRQKELTFDAGKSLSAGTPVFRTHNKVMNQGDVRAGGYSQAGVVLLSDVPAWGPVYAQRQLHHELEHMVQEDQIEATWLRPLQRALLTRLPAGRLVDDWVDLNASTQVLDLLSNVVTQHDVRPWEIEADYLAKRR
ncbi:MAG TPA: hypothetical protein VF832_06195 [Longimicrobiales bacterium]